MTTRVEMAQQADAMVRRGAELLDKVYRCGMLGLADWRSHIDTEELDIDNSKNCILGQLFGDYYVGRGRLEISSETAADCGFAPSGDMRPQVLTLAWVRYLNSCMTPVADVEVPDVVKRDRVYELVKLAASGKRLGLDHVAESAIAAALAEVAGV